MSNVVKFSADSQDSFGPEKLLSIFVLSVLFCTYTCVHVSLITIFQDINAVSLTIRHQHRVYQSYFILVNFF